MRPRIKVGSQRRYSETQPKATLETVCPALGAGQRSEKGRLVSENVSCPDPTAGQRHNALAR
eukprot:10102039-Heterocapsa_arctica.AAC.1